MGGRTMSETKEVTRAVNIVARLLLLLITCELLLLFIRGYRWQSLHQTKSDLEDISLKCEPDKVFPETHNPPAVAVEEVIFLIVDLIVFKSWHGGCDFVMWW